MNPTERRDLACFLARRLYPTLGLATVVPQAVEIATILQEWEARNMSHANTSSARILSRLPTRATR